MNILHDIKNFSDESLRVVDYENVDEKSFLEVQIVGKNLSFRIPVSELMRSKLLMNFSKADIAIITHLGTKKELEKKYAEAKPKLLARIAQQLFGKGGKTKFMLKMPEQEQLVEAIPEEVMVNKEALEMLESKDAAMIGYAAAENRMMEIRKQVSAVPTCKILQQDLISGQITYIDEEREARHILPLKDIFYNKKLLSLFPKFDQQIISFAAGEAYQKSIAHRSSPTLSIVSQNADHFIYQDKVGNQRSASFVEVAFNEDLLLQFSPREQHIIRFVAGELHGKRLSKQEPSLKIVTQTNDLVEYADKDGRIFTASINDLAFNRELLNQFSMIEREIIVFGAGEAHGKKISKSPVSLKLVSQTNGIIDYQDLEGNVFKASCLDIAFNDLILTQFSQKDRDVIKFSAGEDHQKRLNLKKEIEFKLVSYANDVAQYQDSQGNIYSKNFLDLAFDANLLDQFSQSDRDMVRFAAGELSKERETGLRQK